MAVVNVSCSESGDMGSIPELCKNSLPLLGHFAWHWGDWAGQFTVPNGHLHSRFYNAYNFVFLDFVSVDLALTGFKLLKWKSYFHSFGALGSRAWGPDSTTYACCWPGALGWLLLLLSLRAKVTGKSWQLIFQILKKLRPTPRVFQPSPPRLALLTTYKIVTLQGSSSSLIIHLILAVLFGFFLKRLEIKGKDQFQHDFPEQLFFPVPSLDD